MDESRREAVEAFERLVGVSAETVKDGSVHIDVQSTIAVVRWEGFKVLTAAEGLELINKFKTMYPRVTVSQ